MLSEIHRRSLSPAGQFASARDVQSYIGNFLVILHSLDGDPAFTCLNAPDFPASGSENLFDNYSVAGKGVTGFLVDDPYAA